MNTLVLFVNPKRESLGGAFLDAVLRGLKKNHAEDEIQTLDLYREGFDPILNYDQDKRRRDMHRDPDLERFRNQILWAERIVCIYPIWWGRPPAMLLGYFDRMMASRFAYQDLPGRIFPEGLLRGREAICISTMKGPAGYPWLLLGNAHKKLMKVAVFNYVGIKRVKIFEFGSMESPKGKQDQKIQKVESYFSRLL